MELSINKIYHQYILRIVIFALFANKSLLRQPNVYKQAVYSFLKKRLPWQIYLSIDTGEKLSLDEERELILDELLNDILQKSEKARADDQGHHHQHHRKLPQSMCFNKIRSFSGS